MTQCTINQNHRIRFVDDEKHYLEVELYTRSFTAYWWVSCIPPKMSSSHIRKLGQKLIRWADEEDVRQGKKKNR